MKLIIFVSIFIALFYKNNAQQCGSSTAGSILQQVTDRYEYVDGLLWVDNRLLFVDRMNAEISRLFPNGTINSKKLEDLKTISSIHRIKKTMDKYILFADRKMILLSINGTKGSSVMSTLKTITSDESCTLMEAVIDAKGRTIIGVNSEKNMKKMSKVLIIDTNELVRELIPENKIVQTSGIVLTSDCKYLLVADSFENVVYQYPYNENKGTVGKCEVVFNMTDHMSLRGCISTLGITKDNKLWIGMGETNFVMLYDCKKKDFIQYVKLPTSFPTSIAYGGPNLDVLFIGTKKENYEYSILEPGSGAIFAVSGTGTKGFCPNQLPMPPQGGVSKTLELKNSKYMDLEELNRMAELELDS